MAINQEENLGPMKLIFKYNNVFYSFFYDDLSGCIHRSREYARQPLSVSSESPRLPLSAKDRTEPSGTQKWALRSDCRGACGETMTGL